MPRFRPGSDSLEPRRLMASTADVVAVTSGMVSENNLGRYVLSGGFHASDSSLTAADFAATIDWGDGSTTTAVVQAVAPGNPNDFHYAADHGYAGPGTYPILVSVADPAGAGGRYSTSVVATREDLEIRAATPPAALVGAPDPFLIATFNPAGSAGTLDPSAYSATIRWGDGTSSAGLIVQSLIVLPRIGARPGPYEIRGAHAYAGPGVFITGVTVAGPLGSAAAATSYIRADRFDVGPIGGVATTGDPDASIRVAFVRLVDGVADPSTLIVGIDWGDGSKSGGRLDVAGAVDDGGGVRTYTVRSAHAYPTATAQVATVYVLDPASGAVGSTSTNVYVTGETITPLPVGPRPAVVGLPFASPAVAVFSSTDVNPSTSAFRAVIAWGDGAVEPASVTYVGPGPDASGSLVFAVSGRHVYARPGTYIAVIGLASVRGAVGISIESITASIVESIRAVPIAAAEPRGVAPAGGVAIAGFVDTNPAISDPADFVAAIDWGDGSAPTGVSVVAGGRGFVVLGGHAYADPGVHIVRVTIVRKGGPSTVLRGGVAVLP